MRLLVISSDRDELSAFAAPSVSRQADHPACPTTPPRHHSTFPETAFASAFYNLVVYSSLSAYRGTQKVPLLSKPRFDPTHLDPPPPSESTHAEQTDHHHHQPQPTRDTTRPTDRPQTTTTTTTTAAEPLPPFKNPQQTSTMQLKFVPPRPCCRTHGTEQEC